VALGAAHRLPVRVGSVGVVAVTPIRDDARVQSLVAFDTSFRTLAHRDFVPGACAKQHSTQEGQPDY